MQKKRSRLPSFRVERTCPQPVCGIDEAGRGPLAGPVVAAAVILDPRKIPKGIDDSKRLTPAAREELFEAISAQAVIGIGSADVAEIATLNILHASMLAMVRAMAALSIAPAYALVDGDRLPHLACPGTPVIGGDGKSVSIAAASIVAKVTRDRLMCALAMDFPDYGFDSHMGYGTPQHLDALNRLGPTPHHRLGFAPVRLVQDFANSLNPKTD